MHQYSATAGGSAASTSSETVICFKVNFLFVHCVLNVYWKLYFIRVLYSVYSDSNSSNENMNANTVSLQTLTDGKIQATRSQSVKSRNPERMSLDRYANMRFRFIIQFVVNMRSAVPCNLFTRHYQTGLNERACDNGRSPTSAFVYATQPADKTGRYFWGRSI